MSTWNDESTSGSGGLLNAADVNGLRREPSMSRFTVAKVDDVHNEAFAMESDGLQSGRSLEDAISNSSTVRVCTDADISGVLGNLPSSAVASPKQVHFVVGAEPPMPNDDSRSASYATSNACSYRNLQTLEKLPCIDHYRDMMSMAKAMTTRPTLAELHEGAATELDIPEEAHEELKEELQKFSPMPESSGTTSNKLGWIQGVLIRCILCIVGVMLYLRLSWVAGQAGIGLGVIIVLLASTVTTLTALSLCAIATNGEVKGGGAYFLISRSLGPEFGGSIGLIFAFANAVAAAMYVVGFAESVYLLMEERGAYIVVEAINNRRIIALCAIVILLAIVIVGVQFETKAQLVLLAILCISVCSFVIGTMFPPNEHQRAVGITGYNWDTFVSNLKPAWDGETFFSVFAVYFPAATGIMAGANISGDLADPQKAIPIGTLLAIAITTVLYVTCIVVTGSTCVREASGDMVELATTGNVTSCSMFGNCTHGLLYSKNVMEHSSIFPPLVIAGVFAATLSSALASLVSAPKIFQALCKDKLFPYTTFFARGYGRGDEPRPGYLLTFFIACAIILIGDLDAIAPIISNFFLASYALINYACFDASYAQSPGFRPAFKYYNSWLSLFGAVICVAVMFLINWWAALITYALMLALYVYLLRSKPDVNWGSSSQAHAYRSALNAMLRLAQTEEHVKNYRPQILVLTGNPVARLVLLEFASNVTKDVSLLICGHVITVPQPDKAFLTLQKLYIYIGQWLERHKLKAFYLPVASESLDRGVEEMLQLAGLGKLRPNISLLGFKHDWRTCPPEEIVSYVKIIHHAFDSLHGVGVLCLANGCDFSEHMKTLSRVGSEYQPLNVRVHEGGSGSPTHTNGKLLATSSFPSMAIHQTSESGSPVKILQTDLSSPLNDAQQNFPLLSSPSRCLGASCARLDNLDVSRKITASGPPVDHVILSTSDEQKLLSNPEILNYVHQFHQKIKKAVIDVWWLFDDGGLTLLLPHLLTQHKSCFEGARLRVFTITASQHQLEQEQRSMAALLSKFRIDYSDVYVIADIGKKPKHESLQEFESMIAPFMEGTAPSSVAGCITEAELQVHKEKTHRMVRTRELLLKHSTSSNLIIITLPIPRRGITSNYLYMAWLETVTKDLPPVFLLRGNQQSVLTFYS